MIICTRFEGIFTGFCTHLGHHSEKLSNRPETMTSCVHYKFPSSVYYETITFDGNEISYGELKNAIKQQELKVNGILEFDRFDHLYMLINEETNEIYKMDFDMIPQNACVVVTRRPYY